MFTSFTVLLASAVVAQAASSSSSAAAASSTAATNPYIPANASAPCQTYLNTLNEDTSLSTCTSALLAASSAYGPNGNANSPSKSALTSSLDTICGTSITASCPQSLLTGKLASFQTACNADLTSAPNTQVKTIYDTFYGLLPLLAAVCTKDDSGNYCVTESNATSLSSPAVVASSLTRRAESVTAYMPNANAIDSSNLMFLGLDGSASKEALCTTCTRNILTSYISFEANTNYAPGLAQSVLMSGQSALYSGVVSTCGSDFLTSSVQAAGGLGQSGAGAASGALPLRAGGVVASLAGLAGFVALVL